MDITLASGKLLSGDMIVSIVLRTDLSPIPASLEAVVRANDETVAQLVEGAVIASGSYGYTFRIVHVSKGGGSIGVQGKDLYIGLRITALFAPCHQIAFRRRSAVIKENATLGGIYRACGASIIVASDFTVSKFACYRGGIPSYEIAKALQEEGGAIFASGTGLQFVRLADLFRQSPVATLESDTTRDTQSEFLERHEVPSFFSLDDDGGFIFGNVSKVRALQYAPRADARVLFNMTRSLVHQKVLKEQYSPTINAGQIIRVADVNLVVITAAHAYSTGTDGSSANAYSRFWLGTLEE